MKLSTRLFITRFLFLLTLSAAGFSAAAGSAPANQLEGVRSWPSPDSTRVVLDLSGKPDYKIHYLKHPHRLLIDLRSTVSKVNLSKIKNNGPLLQGLRESASGQSGTYRLVLDLNHASRAEVFLLPPEKPYGHRLVLDLPHTRITGKATAVAQKASVAGRDIIIAIDAGHGGEDPGALGKYTYEKNVTLEIAKRLQKRINRQKGMTAFLIRSGDYFVDLNKRSAIARNKKADFLVSIHADGFTSSKPRGASVWVLSNRRATTELGRWIEKHEAHSQLLGGAGELIQDSSSVPFLTEMFLDMSMGNAMDVGYHVGDLVVQELKQVTKLHKQKPVHASLAVLKSPDIPSILVEAGFITNRTEEKLLNQASHQEKIANAVFTGIYKHFVDAPPQNTLFAQRKRAIQHTVRSGESLSALAARYSVSLEELRAYNNLQANTLRIGQVLKVPPNYQLAVQSEPVVKLLAKTPQARIHKVEKGESLSVIAQRYGKTTQELQAYNKLRSTVLAVGQSIKIPGETTSSTVQLAAKPLIHSVSRGESLSVIAQRYGTTTSELKAYNKLRSTSLAVGQKLNIPGNTVAPVQPAPVAVKPAEPVLHEVQRGEPLSVIAQRYGTTTSELKAYNKLRSTSLAVGQKLNIPGDRVAPVQPAAVAVKPVEPLLHEVQRGESLSVIAQRYGTTTHELKAYNKLRSTSLAVGQELNIPGDTLAPVQPAPVAFKPAEPLLHEVQRGESLSVIAQRYGTTTHELKAYNKLRSTSLAVGQKLNIPGNTVAAVPSEPVAVKPAESVLHEVQRGESLSVIAQRYGTTTKELQTYNKLRSTALRVGQKLTIPGEATSTVVQLAAVKPLIHSVSRGESLSVIAQRYGTTTNELKAYNKLRSTSLAVGQKLNIPGNTLAPVPSAPVALQPAEPVLHKVKSGESLSVIAQRYGITTKALQAYNKLSSTSLLVGQQLSIPDADYRAPEQRVEIQPVVHKVARGESLSVIASRYGTTVSALKKYNQLASSSLRVGQKITIPAALAQFTKHKVRSGESLSVIASRYGTTTNALKSVNKLSSNSLMVGQVLTIPVT